MVGGWDGSVMHEMRHWIRWHRQKGKWGLDRWGNDSSGGYRVLAGMVIITSGSDAFGGVGTLARTGADVGGLGAHVGDAYGGAKVHGL
ncbi:hypothetical protein Acr_17g0013740 [Actinidia rufa]|uniref:Uncharacterized protein n=1 Tax=Actinidia rufa TaxID=165716 RepID=A0A7J0G4Y7_9ERIC|nr:hypothetical protein Acr_17g0013740 [Actinidia rufa]